MRLIASGILLLLTIAVAAQPRPSTRPNRLTGDRLADLKFGKLTTRDGLALDHVVSILQDHRGFMWFGTGDGLNRYDGNSFVGYKNDPADPGSLSANFIQDLVEDDRGQLWIAVYPGVNKFDPTTERSVRYLHDPKNPNSLSGDSVWGVTRDSSGHLWFATADSGLDRFDPATETFTHYSKDGDGVPVGWIHRAIEDKRRDIWFVGERGLFHLSPRTGRITQTSSKLAGLSALDVCEDEAGNLWMLVSSPIVGLVKYERQTNRFTEYRLGAGAAEVLRSRLLADGENGFWVPSSLGLSYFDRRDGKFTHLFQYDSTNPHSLSDNSVVRVYRDRAGLLWIGTQNGGLNILNFQQQRFRRYIHRPREKETLSPGKVTAIYEDADSVLWVGVFPRALDRLDRKTGKVTHYSLASRHENDPSSGREVTSILKDKRGYLWLGSYGSGLDRFDERTGRTEHYRHNPGDPHSLQMNDVVRIYEDPSGHLWVGVFGGVSRLDTESGKFTNYRPGPIGSTSLAYTVSAFHRDRSGTLWLGTWSGALSRYDKKTNTFFNYTPDLGNPRRLQGGSIGEIHEDRTGNLWLASGQGLYRFDRQNDTFTRFTESQGLPNVDVMGIVEDNAGMLWISTKRGICRFDPRTETFRNYDDSDGLLSNEFTRSCHQKGTNGEMLFCGSAGITAFFPEDIGDNLYVPPVVITNFNRFNKPVLIGPGSLLTKAIPYLDALTLSHEDSVFSFEFAALSYANSHRNRYRYKLDNFDRGWNEAGSKQRLATYTNLDPGRYVFHVQGSNSDGVWNEEGVSLPIVITPPWYRTNAFLAAFAGLVIATLWAIYQVRLRQLRHEFDMAGEARVNERMRIARELHDTLLQSFQASLIRMQAARNMFDRLPERAVQSLDEAISVAAAAVAEGRNAIQDLRTDSGVQANLAQLLAAAGQEMVNSAEVQGDAPGFRVTVEGLPRKLKPLLQDEVYRIGRELLRNAFQHAHAGRIETEIRYDSSELRVHVRDDGKGIDPEILKTGRRAGHWGLPGMRERVNRFGGKLELWSEAGAGTEAVLTVPAGSAYAVPARRGVFSFLRREKAGS